MKRLNGYTVYLFQEFTASLLFAVIFTVTILYQVDTVGLNPFHWCWLARCLELSCASSPNPTGIIADVYSRRLSIIIGFVLVGIGFIVEGSIPQFWAILLAQVIWASALPAKAVRWKHGLPMKLESKMRARHFCEAISLAMLARSSA